MTNLSQAFSRFAEATSRHAGKPVAFLLAMTIVIAWGASGPVFHFGDTWQLVINTGTTIVTFLMVFLIQNSQNREGASLHIKLDELIRVTQAQNCLLNLEGLDDETLDTIRGHYQKLADSPNREDKKAGGAADDEFGPVARALRAAAAGAHVDEAPAAAAAKGSR